MPAVKIHLKNFVCSFSVNYQDVSGLYKWAVPSLLLTAYSEHDRQGAGVQRRKRKDKGNLLLIFSWKMAFRHLDIEPKGILNTNRSL